MATNQIKPLPEDERKYRQLLYDIVDKANCGLRHCGSISEYKSVIAEIKKQIEKVK